MLTPNSVATALVLALCSSGVQFSLAQETLVGSWNASLDCPGGPLRFGIEIKGAADALAGFFVNGPERIKIPSITFDGASGSIDIPHYDSRISFSMEKDASTISGEWTKRRGVEKWTKMPFTATKSTTAVSAQTTEQVSFFVGRWATKFKSDADPSVADFRVNDASQRIVGTFLTTTGDYRFLDSRFENGVLVLSCFDGAHAFLFHVRKTGQDSIKGDFWSSDTWHDSFEGKRDDSARLPDAFKETSLADESLLGRLSFPDLDGKPTRLDDPKFAGKARIIYVFGSWCPNCHDAADYFSELNSKYQDQGLSILGLAFEHTGNFERDAEQIRRYLERHNSNYPVLLAGLSDKKEASKAFPVLDRVRSYPTTIFLDGTNKVRSIHTGFTGPATGNDFVELKQKFESLIETMIAESK